MPRPYLCLFDSLALPAREVMQRIEPILATGGVTFDGCVRNFERHTDGAVYFSSTSFKAGTVSEALQKAAAAGWPGFAIECHYRGYDLTVGVLSDDAGTTLAFEQDTVPFYEMERDLAVYRQWLTIILNCAEAVKANVCVLQRGGEKQAAAPEELLETLREKHLQRGQNPIVVMIRESIFSYEQAVAQSFERFHVETTASGYVVITWLHHER